MFTSMDLNPTLEIYLNLGFPFSYIGVLTTKMLHKQCAWPCPSFFFSKVCPCCLHLNAQELTSMELGLWVLLSWCSLITAKTISSSTFSFGRHWVWLPVQHLGIEKLAVWSCLIPMLSTESFGTQCSTVKSVSLCTQLCILSLYPSLLEESLDLNVVTFIKFNVMPPD